MLASVSGMVDRVGPDHAREDPVAGGGKLPYTSDPIVMLAAKDGFSADAGQSFQLTNGETLALISGQDAQFVDGGRMRLHSKQAIGVLAGAVEAGKRSIGLQISAANDGVDIAAQADSMIVQAREEISLASVGARVDLAAAKRISLSTAGGANITIEGGHITVQCPGTLMVHAGKKSFTDSAKLAFEMPALPRSICIACLKKSLAAGPAFTMVE